MKTMKRVLVGAIFVLMAAMAVEGMFFNQHFRNRLGPRPELAGTFCTTDNDCASGECCTMHKRCRSQITNGMCYPYKISRKETCDCEDGMKCQVFSSMKWSEVYNQKGSCVPEDQWRAVISSQDLKVHDDWSDKNPSGAKIWLGNKFRNSIGYSSGVLSGRRGGRKRRSGEQTAP
ncbi:Hypp9521 [Branchiostoma lanceolatum]|uniref:Hypp3234 protein n=1 Tax=Branchiostoma lanceolatum TaxID=7740 RepID=A0A8J9ZY46_BRALA|nr:Hypp3234 [Branchiostoma lanceolatum]CAH1277246.1 Hypp9521 [Branchiostoma lanceolatum]